MYVRFPSTEVSLHQQWVTELVTLVPKNEIIGKQRDMTAASELASGFTIGTDYRFSTAAAFTSEPGELCFG